MLTLYHLTEETNLDSIQRHGFFASDDGLVYFSLGKYDTIFFSKWAREILFKGGKESAPPLVILGVKFDKFMLKKCYINPMSVTDDNGFTHIAAEIMYPGDLQYVGKMDVTPISAEEILNRYQNSDYT